MTRRNCRDILKRVGFFLPLQVFAVLTVELVLAQSAIVPDDTLGEESSQVRTDEVKGIPAEVIEGGAQRGSNLFHSFSEFNVNNGRGAYFANPTGVENILGRVTGANPSQILGTLGVRGDANLFLINPNGIIFGQNARLDVNGSFLGSTADSLLFPDGEFSARDTQTEPLLTINVPIGLGLGDNPGAIVNRSFVLNSAGDDSVGLEVPIGENLTFVGGNINFEGGNATASGGRIELGGLQQAGTVTFNSDGSLSFPKDTSRANVTLSNGADVDVTGTGGGDIAINAGNLSLKAGELGISRIRAGITADSTNSEAQAGDIIIDATNNITAVQSSIVNQVGSFEETQAEGNAGKIAITTGSLSLSDGGKVNANTWGRGNAGSVQITARDTITINSEDSRGSVSGNGISSQVTNKAEGNAGNITITTGSLSLSDGGRVSANTLGTGNAGTVSINANDTITIDGEDSNGVSRITSGTGLDAKGNAGEITITTNSLSLTNGGRVGTNQERKGNAGTVEITANDIITIEGEGEDSRSPSLITSRVGEKAEGEEGEITITTGLLSLTNGGAVSATTLGKGNAGTVEITANDTITIDGEDSNGSVSRIISGTGSDAKGNAGEITITTNSLSLTNGGRVGTNQERKGNAGTVSINARDSITIDGEDSNSNSSLITSRIGNKVEGDAGEVAITTNSLSLTNGGVVSAGTLGTGNAGTVEITASDTITINGEDSQGSPSRVTSGTGLDAKGNAGEVTITTGSLSLTNGGVVFTNQEGTGNVGTVSITARDTITIDGEGLRRDDGSPRPSGITSRVGEKAEGEEGEITITAGSLSLTNSGRVFASTLGTGNGGNVNITADRVTLKDRGRIAVSSQGDFNPGNLNITADNITLDDRSTIEANTESGSQGNITLNTQLLTLRDNSSITTNATEDATGGNITINAEDGFIIAVPQENSDITANAERGRGGRVTIDAQSLFGIEAREQQTPLSDITASSDLGVQFGGDVTINTPELDPESGLNELPTVPIDADAIIAQNFCNLENDRIAGGSSFTIIGKGGLPPTVDDPITNQTRIVDWAKPAEESFTPSRNQSEINSHNTVAENTQPVIQQARGWAKTKDGKVVLTADAPIIAPQTGKIAFPNCTVN